MSIIIASAVFCVIHLVFLCLIMLNVKELRRTMSKMEVAMEAQKEALAVMAYKSDEYV